jgi:hypothetical protein
MKWLVALKSEINCNFITACERERERDREREREKFKVLNHLRVSSFCPSTLAHQLCSVIDICSERLNTIPES